MVGIVGIGAGCQELATKCLVGMDPWLPLLRHRTIDPDTGCWIWLGAVDARGRPIYAHTKVYRRAAELALNLPPNRPDIFVRQTCRQRRCFNPEHLRLTSSVETSRSNCKLTAEDVRWLRTQSQYSMAAAAAKLGVLEAVAYRAAHGITWKHFDTPPVPVRDAWIESIRKRVYDGENYLAVATEYGWSRQAMLRCLRGKTYSHLPFDPAWRPSYQKPGPPKRPSPTPAEAWIVALPQRTIDPRTGCWLWTGRLSAYGYGTLTLRNRHFAPHRLAGILFHGLDPAVGRAVYVCHHCDVKHCFNPEHVYIGTPQQNSDDMVRRGRSYRGVQHHDAKMTPDAVRALRKAAAEGTSHKALARRFGISSKQVRDIVKRRYWKHV